MKALVNLALNVALVSSYPSREDESFLIVREMSDSVETREEVPTDCWVKIVDDLSQPSKSLIHPQFSIGASFCSSLESYQKQVFAFGLTKCHMHESGKSFLIPNNCEVHGISQGTNQSSIVDCLSSLPEPAFLIYSQFFTHTELMCMKLTEDLRVHHKNDVLDRFEESVKIAGAKFESIQHRFEESGIVFDRLEESAKMMDARIDNIAKIEGFARTIDEKIESVDEKIENMIGKTIMNSIDQTAKSIVAEVYGNSGLERISSRFNKLKHRGLFNFSTLRTVARLSMILMGLLFTFTSKRLRRCRKFIFWVTFAELVSEHMIHYLANIGFIETSEYDQCAKLCRACGSSLYLVALLTSFVSSFMLDDSSKEGSENSSQISPSTVSQMNAVLEEMQERFRKESESFRNEREQMMREREQLQHQMVSLHRQLHESFSSRQHQHEPYSVHNISRYTTPVSRVTEDQSFVHPYVSPLSGRLTPRFFNDDQNETSAVSLVNTNDTTRRPSLSENNNSPPIHTGTPASAFSPVISSNKRKRYRHDNDLHDDESFASAVSPSIASEINKRKRLDKGFDGDDESSKSKKQKGND